MSRSGGKSCRFCMGTNYKAWLSRSGRTNVVPGRHYHGEIWIKGAETPQVLDQFGWTGSSLNLFSVDDSGGETTGPTTAADWVRLTTLFEAPRANESVGITINLFQEGNPAAVGDRICFYLDDAIVRPID